MKFLVDAQLPRRLSDWLSLTGHDARHTLDLASGNLTPDHEIARIAQLESRVVITKDNDFVRSYLIERTPPHLLLISTGNIANDTLMALFQRHIGVLCNVFDQHTFVELSPTHLIIHQ